MGGGGGGRLFEAGRLLTFSAFRVGANSRLGAYSNKYGIIILNTLNHVLHRGGYTTLRARPSNTKVLSLKTLDILVQPWVSSPQLLPL